MESKADTECEQSGANLGTAEDLLREIFRATFYRLLEGASLAELRSRIG